MAENPRTILDMRNVSYAYPGRTVPAVRMVTLAAKEGSVTAVLGPNGAGKSTLLDLASGRLRPREGAVFAGGRDISQYARRELGRLLGFVPQSEHIPFEYSLEEYVLLGRAPHLRPLEMPGREDRLLAREALDRAGLAPRAEDSINSLSGGERQLLMIARALAQKPRLLLLDEPSSHLDLANKRRIAALFRSMAGSGIGVLFTTHDPEAVFASADILYILADGGMVAAGPPESALTGEVLERVYGKGPRVFRRDGEVFVSWR